MTAIAVADEPDFEVSAIEALREGESLYLRYDFDLKSISPKRDTSFLRSKSYRRYRIYPRAEPL